MTGYTVPTANDIYVPETLLKKRKTTEKAAATLALQKTQKQVQLKSDRNIIFKKADAYIQEYRQREDDECRLRRQSKNNGQFYVPPEAKLLFVVRIKGVNGLHPKVNKVLQLFRLLQLNNGVFVRINKATKEMLQIIEPYVTYGPPNLKTVREVIYKRGYVKVKGQRLPIHDNEIIKQHLGKYGIICIEDVIHEIYTVGDHFKQVNNFLWPFKLSNPSGHKKASWRPRKATHYVEGGDAGDREFDINRLVQSMN
ncbi:60S ribosomal protein L7 [Backusella circina FSU 941]|nr:60S ribosomal protein L7 [Backusella circina FSU 941]